MLSETEEAADEYLDHSWKNCKFDALIDKNDSRYTMILTETKQ